MIIIIKINNDKLTIIMILNDMLIIMSFNFT